MGLFSCWKKQKRDLNVYCWQVMDHIHYYLDFKKTNHQERIAFLEFAIKAVGLDIAGACISEFLCEEVDSTKLLGLFPILRPPTPLSKIKDFSTDEKTVVTLPYDWRKAINAVMDIQREGFLKGENDTNGIYIPEFDMVIVVNGRHHFSAAAASHKKPAVSVEVYPLKEVFSEMKVSQDGANWVIGDKTYPILDGRFAVLYLLAQELDGLKNSSPTDQVVDPQRRM